MEKVDIIVFGRNLIGQAFVPGRHAAEPASFVPLRKEQTLSITVFCAVEDGEKLLVSPASICLS
jgi:hypothetical protein